MAFSGEPGCEGRKLSEASLNGFAGADLAERIQGDACCYLICADEFQTGCDRLLRHTMPVDKAPAGIQAVQTLPRLNRARRCRFRGSCCRAAARRSRWRRSNKQAEALQALAGCIGRRPVPLFPDLPGALWLAFGVIGWAWQSHGWPRA